MIVSVSSLVCERIQAIDLKNRNNHQIPPSRRKQKDGFEASVDLCGCGGRYEPSDLDFVNFTELYPNRVGVIHVEKYFVGSEYPFPPLHD